jgi:hypothetical protein
LRLPDSVPPGGAIRCPKCKATLRVPGKAPAPATPKTAATPQIRTTPAPKSAAKQPPAPPPRAIKPAAAKTPRAKPRDDDEIFEDSDDDIKATRSVKAKSKKGLLIGLLAGVAALFLVCGGVSFGVYRLLKRGAEQVQQSLNEIAEQIKQAEKKRLDVTFIHADCNAAFVLHPSRMVQSKLLAPEERDKLVAGGIQEAGIDITKLEQVIVVLEPTPPGQPGNRPQPPRPQPPRRQPPRPRPGMKPGQQPAPANNEPAPITFAAILRFTEPVDGMQILNKGLVQTDQVQAGDKTYLRSKSEKVGDAPLAGHFDGQHVILMGAEPMIVKMLAAKDVHSPLTEKLREFELDNDIFGIFMMSPFKPMLKGLAQAPNIPPQLEQVKKLDQTLSAVKVLVNLDGEKPLQIVLLGEDDASGPNLESLARNALEMGKAFYPLFKMGLQQGMQQAVQQGAPPKAGEKLFKVTDQIMAQDGITVTREGKNVTVALNRPKDL